MTTINDWWTGVTSAIARALTIPEGGIDTIIAEGKAIEQKLIDGAKQIANWFVSDEPTIVADASTLLTLAETLVTGGFDIPAPLIALVKAGIADVETLFQAVEAAEGVMAAESIASVLPGSTPEQILLLYTKKNSLRTDTNSLRVAVGNAQKK
jgi:hypothetical protein